MKKSIVFLAIAAAALASCQKETISKDNISVMNAKVITAITDNNVVSKTSLSEAGAILWTADDAVTAFVGSEKYASTETSVSADGKTATFTFATLPAESTVDYILYPADAKASISEGKISTQLPTLQRIVAGSFANGANVAVATGDKDVQFKNAGAFLSIKVNGEGIKSVKLIADKAMTGNTEISLEGSEPVAVAAEGAQKYAQLSGNFVSGGTYYFVVLPGTYNGLSIEFTNNQGKKATFTNSNTLTVGRNENLHIANITIPDSKWEDVIVENAVNMSKARLYPKWEGAKLGTVSAFTMEAMVYVNSFVNDHKKIFSIMGIEDVFNCRIRKDISNYSDKNIMQISSKLGGSSFKLDITGNEVQEKQWYHFAVTFDNGVAKVYFNGEKVGEKTLAVTSINMSPDWTLNETSSTRCFWYGYSYEASRFIDAKFAEMRIWNKALSAEEISAPGHFYVVEPTADGLFAYWRTDNPTGNTIMDATGRGNTLYGHINVTTASSNNPGINWNEDITHSISVSPATKSFSADACNFDVDVTAEGSWTVSGAPEWITLSATAGEGNGQVNVSAAANTGDKRTATLTFACGKHESTVAISQNASSIDEPLTLGSGSSDKNYYFNQFDSNRTYCKGGTLEWNIVDNDQAWTATLQPENNGATLTYDTTTKKVKLVVSNAASATRDVKCWTVTVARTNDKKPLVMCAYMQNYVKNGKPTLCTYEFSENTIAEGTYVISTMDSGNTKPYCLWNGISSNEARTYDLQCFLWTRSAGDKDPASFWYPDLSRISAIRVENLYDIKAKGDGTYTIRPVGNSACGLGEVDDKLMVAAECANTGWRITKGNYGWNFQCGSKYLVVQSGTPETGTSYKSLGSCTASNTLKFGNSASATSTQYIRLFRAAYADTHAGDKDSKFTNSDTTLSVSTAGSSESVTIYTAPSWTASSDASWVSVDKTSGTGVENTLNITAAANTTGAARSAVVSVTSNGYTCKIIVNQQ